MKKVIRFLGAYLITVGLYTFAMLLAGCGGAVEPTPSAACFAAGPHLGQCADPHVLWVGCDAQPELECSPGSADGQWCCPTQPECTRVEGADICEPGRWLESCESAQSQPAGCIAPIGSALQENSKYWCCQ